MPGEELLLIVVTGTPREHRTDIQRLTLYLTNHVFRQHAFGRILVVRAAGSMDVVVA